MLNQLESATVIYQRITGNTRLLMVSLRESTINHHQFAFSLDGILTLRGMNGHMTVDDMAIRSLDTKGIENTVADLLIVTQLEIIAFLFFVGLLV